jgi:CRISPR-associated protein Cmr4
MVQAAGLKGCLRATYREVNGLEDEHEKVQALFGKAGEKGENFAGALAPGDARILLLPVRSLAGVFAWTTSIHALEAFKRAARLTGQEIGWDIPTASEKENALSGKPSDLQIDQNIILEEFSFVAQTTDTVNTIAQWLANNALLPEYEYWKKSLPKRLCILPEDAFRDFCLYATEVQTHVKLKPKTKTVEDSALWTTESLPADSLLYAPLMATGIRNGKDNRSAAEVLAEVESLNLTRLQLGGDETTGQGWVTARFYPALK